MTINTKLPEAEIDKINGFWPTPVEAVLPLIPHLGISITGANTWFAEPCAGNGDLVRALEANGMRCQWASDINPKNILISKMDYTKFLDEYRRIEGVNDLQWLDWIITNPPFSRHHTKTLLDMIDKFRAEIPTWLLLPAGFAFNDNSQNAMIYCKKIVPIGRVKWVEGTEHKSSKDFAWFLFQSSPAKTEFCQKQIIKKSKGEIK